MRKFFYALAIATTLTAASAAQAMAETARLLRRAATRALGLYRRRGGDN